MMQQHSSGRSNTRKAEVEALVADVGRILEKLAVIGPVDVTSVVLALPNEVAQYLDRLAQQHGAPLHDVHVSTLLHGCYHAALEHEQQAAARELAGLIRRMAPPQEWERFCAQHPEAREGL